ncbi:hypothetical protein [Thermococcus barophilus]|uniref:Uncharacterized protein n=1 Tax=Thermococcus barophilus TaxID=55802 RepID=A0A0S1X9P3_THEBA|nr:hypothetical protein [Thermococcus barophilus]ALM74509.1 hypothetical protein TBCH5v1_0542 [Thermococcus barophilus]
MEALAYQAAKRRITTDPEKTAKVMEKAFEKTFKIIDKLLPEVNEKNLEILGRAIHKHTDDSFVVLRNAGINIEPELEEFRQFLAEISGRKTETEDLKVRIPKTGIPSEVLSIAKGLEFADFSENAMQKAEKELLELIDGLLDDEKNALWVFYAVKLLRLIQRKDLGGIKKFED